MSCTACSAFSFNSCMNLSAFARSKEAIRTSFSFVDEFFVGANRFIAIPPGGTPAPETRVTTALEFLTKANAAGATHGVVLSVVVADRRRGLFGERNVYNHGI